METKTTALFYLNNGLGSGEKSDQIYVSIFGKTVSSKTEEFVYLDLEQFTLKQFTSYESGVTSKKLSELSAGIKVPAMRSARMYFTVGKDFDASDFNTISGPSPSKIINEGASVLYDFIEFDTSVLGAYNINPTNVVMYATSYTVELENVNGRKVSVGINKSRADVINDFLSIPQSETSSWYQDLIVKDSCRRILRILAPQQPAYFDVVQNKGYHLLMTNYFRKYLKNEVFKRNRQFTFYDKYYPEQKNLYQGEVNYDGSILTISRVLEKHNYFAPESFVLKLPCNTMNSAEIREYWHNLSRSSETTDWGFMFFGNALVPTLPCGWGHKYHGEPHPAVMALLISICRGVAHLDGEKWVVRDNYFQNQMPEFYAKIIHKNATGNLAYAFAYDDIYGQNPSTFFKPGTEITFNLHSLKSEIFMSV